jgi:hydroxymethylpyrimidine pyrophosphatase-like HAD family hydrolase
MGAVAKISSIHVNVWMGNYSKVDMAVRFLETAFGIRPETDREKILFVGDSPNDEPMFAHYPNACAVANIVRYKNLLEKEPSWVSNAECADGFTEIVDTLLTLRSR